MPKLSLEEVIDSYGGEGFYAKTQMAWMEANFAKYTSGEARQQAWATRWKQIMEFVKWMSDRSTTEIIDRRPKQGASSASSLA